MDVSPLANSGEGDRVLASAGPGDDAFSVTSNVENESVSCSGATFAADEARQLALMDDCRDRAQEKIEVTPCTGPFGCSVGNQQSTPWWLLVLGLAAFRLIAGSDSSQVPGR